MFSAWNFSQWVGSVVVVTVMLSIIVTFAALVAYVAMKIAAEEESQTQENTILNRVPTEPESSVRRAA
jgi:hypothetical protein